MEVTHVDLALLLGAAVLLTAIVALRYATRLGVPGLLAYLAIGLALQPVIHFDDPGRAQDIALPALALILAEGGLSARWDDVRDAVPASILLSLVGVGVSLAVVGLLAHPVLGGSWRLAFLLGAIVSSTDAAAVLSTLRHLRLPKRLVGVLELESGLNDAPAVIAVALLSAEHPQTNALVIVGLTAYELVAGAVIGIVAAWLGVQGLRRIALPASGLYPVAVLGFAVVAYAAASLAHASGFLAVYVAGLILGNARLPHRPATRGFADGVAWMAQIGLFVMLGVLATPSALHREIGPAVAVGAALLLIGRPLAVFASVAFLRLPRLRRFRLNLPDQLFLSWAGLRGAVPIVLATVPVTAGVAHSSRLFDIVFVLVVVFTLVQGPTLPAVARALRVTAPGEAADLGVEAAPLVDIDADLLQLRIPPDSRLHGVEIFELRLPKGSGVTLVVRDGVGFVPTPETQLRVGDELLVVATSRSRLEVERRLRAVSRRGRLAAWYGERGG